MIRYFAVLSTLAMVCWLTSAVLAGEDAATPAWIAQGRDLSRQLGEELKAELGRTMEKGGPIGAIPVCRDQAPTIAARLSALSGARVGRTALAVRNPRNAPDEFDRAVLEGFARALEAGGVEGPLEAAFWVNRGGTVERRYLRAIVTDGLCVTCHGADIAPDLAAAIAREYPQDKATGFSVGQLRGAFKIVWPAATATGPSF